MTLGIFPFPRVLRDRLDAQIGQHLVPFDDAVARLDEIPAARVTLRSNGPNAEPLSVGVERLPACFAPADEEDGLWILLPKCSW
jgi:hypothetical protein